MATATISGFHHVSTMGRFIDCTCGLSGRVESDEANVRLSVGHAHLANPALPFDELIAFVLRGSGG